MSEVCQFYVIPWNVVISFVAPVVWLYATLTFDRRSFVKPFEASRLGQTL